MRRINAAGLQIIKDSEGLRLTAYRCPAGLLSVGYGHTGPEVYEGMTITEAQADDYLELDVDAAEAVVESLCPMGISDNMFSALVSLVFNIGGEAFRTSTLLRKLQSGDMVGAANEFLRWNHGGGHELPGLTARREKEMILFSTPDRATA